MTCREVLEFLMAYLDGELPTQERAMFEEHLSICPSCQSYLQSYRDTVRVSQAASELDSDASVASLPEDLVQAILSARTKGA